MSSTLFLLLRGGGSGDSTRSIDAPDSSADASKWFGNRSHAVPRSGPGEPVEVPLGTHALRGLWLYDLARSPRGVFHAALGPMEDPGTTVLERGSDPERVRDRERDLDRDRPRAPAPFPWPRCRNHFFTSPVVVVVDVVVGEPAAAAAAATSGVGRSLGGDTVFWYEIWLAVRES